jgi:quercetin dioxygenase-like cupin family protein
MKIEKIKNMKGGWFVGNFDPVSYKTDKFEVSYKVHPKGQKWETHYHTKVTEINYVIRGKMVLQDVELNEGDIFTLYPYEIANPVFLEDTEIVCIKTPSSNDKVVVKEI